MPQIPLLVLSLLVSAAPLTAQENPQTGSSLSGVTTGQTTAQDHLDGFNREEVLQMNNPGSIHAKGQSQAVSHTRAHAEAKIRVQSSEAKPYDQTAGPALMEIHLSETFTGDIDGEATVRALQVQRDHQSASLVSMQRFRGKLAGRQGTFVLQGQETVEHGQIKAAWFVVPGSGTGDLSSLFRSPDHPITRFSSALICRI